MLNLNFYKNLFMNFEFNFDLVIRFQNVIFLFLRFEICFNLVSKSSRLYLYF